MRAVVLVGGQGTRLQPLTLDVPKQMLVVAEQRMIERVLTWLADHGVDEAVLSLGYRPDAFLAAFPEHKACGVRLAYAVDPEPLGTAGAIRWAAAAAGIEETFLALNGDVLSDADLGQLTSFHRRCRAEATIQLTPVADPSSFGVVPTAADGRVEAFIEKPAAGAAPTNLVNAGAYVLEPSVLGRIPAGRPVSLERETFPALVADGSLYALALDTYWVDAGTPATYRQACLDLAAGRRGPPAPGARAVADGLWVTGSPILDGEAGGGSLVADAAFVARGASVAGSVVGTGARIEPGATVAGSVLLAGAVVGPGSTVEGSILGEGARVGPDAEVGALSVVGNGAAVGAGCRLVGARVPG